MAQWSAHHMRTTDSRSLWNNTLSPGWSVDEVRVLRLAIMKIGMGRWQDIAAHLPGKNVAQINLQAQRMLGQQSLGEFMDLHLDPLRVFEANSLVQGESVKRKGGVLVNTGAAMTKSERLAKIEENRAKYGLSVEEIAALEIPVLTAVQPLAVQQPAAFVIPSTPLTRSSKLVLLELMLERQRAVEERLESLGIEVPPAKRPRLRGLEEEDSVAAAAAAVDSAAGDNKPGQKATLS